MTARPLRGDSSGFMLIQVVAMSGILLLMIFAGFKTVRTTIQVTNTTATSSSFQDLIRKVEMSLAMTTNCKARLVNPPLFGNALDTLLSDPNEKHATTVNGPGNTPVARVELPNQPVPSMEFKITEVNLTGFRKLGRHNGELGLGTQMTDNYTGMLSIAAEKRSEFLGGATMRTNIPVMFMVDKNVAPHQLRTCTTRSLFQIELGPPNLPAGVIRKSGLECFDRGGFPVRPPTQTWYYCAIPESALINCVSLNYYWPKNSGAEDHPEGWHCDSAYPGIPKVAYAY